MSERIDILCLANSVKHQHRCVAGVRLDTGGWIRPVSTTEGGSLYQDQYTTKCGKEVRPGDSVRIYFDEHCPDYHQPENWLISKEKSWELVGSELNRPQVLALNAALQRKGEIFPTENDSHSRNDVCMKEYLRESLSTHSLTLIRPRNIDFFTERKGDGSKQPRAKFEFGNNKYNLSVTDPRWREQAENDRSGDLPSPSDVDDNEEILFTISLGDAFKGCCHKLVAAVLVLNNKYILDV